MIGPINVMFWNARSIYNKIPEFFSFLLLKYIDICLVNETWLDSSKKFYHPQYHCIRADRQNRRGGGVAIVIKKGIVYKQLGSIATKVIENVGIEIQLDQNRTLKIYSIYFPGGRNSPELMPNYREDMRKLLNVRGNFVLCGDLNSRHRNWGCFRSNCYGNILNNLSENFPFSILFPNSPTYIPASASMRPSTLDLLLTNVPSQIQQPFVANSLASDHLPVLFSLDISVCLQEDNVFNYSKTNWKIFARCLSSILSNSPHVDVSSTPELEYEIKAFTTNIITSIEASTPRFVNKFRNTNYLNIPRGLINLIKERNYFRREWQRYRQNNDINHYNYLTKLVKNWFWHLRNKNWKTRLSNLDNRSKPFWKISKVLRKRFPHIPPIKIGSTFVSTDYEKANALGNTFCTNHNLANNLGCWRFDQTVSEVINRFDERTCFTDQTEYISVQTLKQFLKNLKTRKACGLDMLRNEFLKNLPSSALDKLTNLLNLCLQFQYFPKAWREANVIPILKHGKSPIVTSSYRPISLLSSLGKLFEKILKEKIYKFIEENELIPKEQFGFRPLHNTTQQIKRITKYIKTSLTEKSSTALVLLDVEKAFDTVWHKGLVYKLIINKFPSFLIKIVQSFLADRTFYVSVNSVYSGKFGVDAGVPQGSVLGPLLYLVYCCDIQMIPSCNYAFYADDTAIFVSGLSPTSICLNIQSALSSLNQFFNKWKIKVNADKSQAIFFTRKISTRHLPNTNLVMNGIDIPWNQHVKYLGVLLDRRLTFREHINSIKVKFNLAIKMMYPLVNRKSTLSTYNKITLVKSIFQPIILYACPVWGTCAKSHILKIQICQNKLLRMVMNLPWDYSTRRLHMICDIDFILNRIQIITSKFQNTCNLSDNVYIQNLYE